MNAIVQFINHHPQAWHTYGSIIDDNSILWMFLNLRHGWQPQAYFVSIWGHCEFLETWDYQIQNKIINFFFCVELLHNGNKNDMGIFCHKFIVF